MASRQQGKWFLALAARLSGNLEREVEALEHVSKMSCRPSVTTRRVLTSPCVGFRAVAGRGE